MLAKQLREKLNEKIKLEEQLEKERQEKRKEQDKRNRDDVLAKFPEFLDIIVKQCEISYGFLVIDQEQEWLINGFNDQAHIILEEKFEDIRNFGIQNGFRVTAQPNKILDPHPLHEHPSDLADLIGPQITFEW